MVSNLATRSAVVVITLLGGLTGCEGPCDEEFSGPSSLEIGEGPEGFERALADGDTMRTEFGPQGGYHVWPAVRTRGFAPGSFARSPTFRASLYDGDFLIREITTIETMEGTRQQAELGLRRLALVETEPKQFVEEATYQLEVEARDICDVTLDAAVNVLISVEPYFY